MTLCVDLSNFQEFKPKTMEVLLYTLAIVITIISFIPLIKNDYWTFRVFEFPRVQKLILTFLVTAAVIYFCKPSDEKNLILLALTGTIIYLFKQIIPYTPLGKKQILKAMYVNRENNLKLMISNVFEENTHYDECLKEIKKADPDVVLLLETNKVWERETSMLEIDYPFFVKKPLNNTYGMLLYSRFPLHNSEVKFMVEHDIPSIHTQVELPSGQLIQLYCLHPTPPVPNENPRSTERDKELLIIAEMSKDHPLPVIVCGDMNDVAWSYTTELFLKISGLLDPRRGRGMINTFHAHYPIMRFPLDHVFCSTDFKLVKLKRLSNFQSDHFPIFIQVQFEKNAEEEQEGQKLEADQADKQEAREKVNKI